MTTPVTSIQYSRPAPPFSLPASTGGNVALSDFKGRDVVLVFYCYDFGSI
ncbi:MAG: redoxin domain-containing protein [Candidatus Rokubacteria bacterium]|nr:redoxin domain-containing protein [Candidatus Rokubacteria bacterium]